MARQTLAAQALSLALLNPTTYTITSDGCDIPLADRQALQVTNDSGGAVNLVFDVTFVEDGVSMGDKSISVPDGTVKALIKPPTKNIYRQDGNRLWFGGTGLKVALVTL